ncbi:hypothetical protein DFJ73DRAFT_800734 [Zopfochytrium polystomum]|nr:hypothetical protein DFJ73DRAFT_800734 [Zopfochytrium polystomum]
MTTLHRYKARRQTAYNGPPRRAPDASSILVPGAAAVFYVGALIAIVLILLRPAVDHSNRTLVWVAACLVAWSALHAVYVPLMVASSQYDVDWAASVAVIESMVVVPVTIINFRHFVMIQSIPSDRARQLIHIISESFIFLIAAFGVAAASFDKWHFGDTHSSIAWTIRKAVDCILLIASAVPMLSFVNRQRDLDESVVGVVSLQGLLQTAVLAFFVGRDMGIVLYNGQVMFGFLVLGAGVVNLMIFLDLRLLNALHPLRKVVERLQME